MPQLDVTTYLPQLTWLVITFIGLLLVMWRVVVPRVGGVLEARQRRIEENLDKAAVLKKDSEAAMKAYDAALAEARAAAHAVLAEAKAELAHVAADRRAKLDETLFQTIAAAEARIAEAKDKALEGLDTVTTELAGAAVKQLTGKAPDKKTLAMAVDAVVRKQG